MPRNLDVDQLSDYDMQEIVLTANLTPRQCLGFKTPFQAIHAELGKNVPITPKFRGPTVDGPVEPRALELTVS